MIFSYSTVKNVRLISVRPEMSNAKLDDPIEFTLDSVQIDNQQYANTLDIDLGDIKSGETRQVFMNFSASNQVNL